MRQQIRERLRDVLEPLDDALAFWELGSAATGRADAMSDLDLLVMVADGRVQEAQHQIEAVLQELGPIAQQWELPRPTWHGHWQGFYRLQGTDPYLLIDLVILEESHPNRFLEPELHGRPVVYFDKKGLLLPVTLDAREFAARLQARLPLLETQMELFHPFVDKEILRGREVDALQYYRGLILPRVVEALRMQYAPWRHNFGYRYLSHDLPPAVYDQVRSLLFVADARDLEAKKDQALQLFRRTLAELRELDLVARLEETRR